MSLTRKYELVSRNGLSESVIGTIVRENPFLVTGTQLVITYWLLAWPSSSPLVSLKRVPSLALFQDI